jgi:hypothetical protein
MSHCLETGVFHIYMQHETPRHFLGKPEWI